MNDKRIATRYLLLRLRATALALRDEVETVETRLADTADTRAVLRHLLATLAYRAAKVLRDMPPTFAEFSAGPNWRRPVLIVAHLADLMAWGLMMLKGDNVWRAEATNDWNTEVRRFFDAMVALDQLLASDTVFNLDRSAEMLIQGPLADALTHVGQLAMLRSAAGIPVRPESYARADIVRGRVGPDQTPAGREFDGDASVRS